MTGAQLSLSAHPNPEIRRVLEELDKQKWVLRDEGHWGRLYCPCAGKCTTIPVPGTPRNPGQAARRIARVAARCPLDPDDPRRSLAGRPRDSE